MRKIGSLGLLGGLSPVSIFYGDLGNFLVRKSIHPQAKSLFRNSNTHNSTRKIGKKLRLPEKNYAHSGSTWSFFKNKSFWWLREQNDHIICLTIVIIE